MTESDGPRSGSDASNSDRRASAASVTTLARLAPIAGGGRLVGVLSNAVLVVTGFAITVLAIAVFAITVLAIAVLATGTASAHTGTAGSGVPPVPVVAVSALVGTASGLAAVAVGTRRAVGVVTHRGFAVALAIGLTVLGVSFVVPVLGEAPAVAIAGACVGVVLARWIPHRHARAVASEHSGLVLGVVAAIGLHRLFEGVVLATGFLAGTSIGLLTAVVVTLHAAGETVVVATILTLDGRGRLAVVAVLAIQAGFVLAAAGTVFASLSIPLVLRSLGVTVAAGVLVYFGAHECTQCFLDWRATV